MSKDSRAIYCLEIIIFAFVLPEIPSCCNLTVPKIVISVTDEYVIARSEADNRMGAILNRYRQGVKSHHNE